MKKLLIAGYSDSTVNYQNAFRSLGASFDTLPPKGSDSVSATKRRLPLPSDYDGLVLPGGGDIAPVLFGAENHGSRDIDDALDRLQLKILEEFLQAGKPVLGICKGLQLLNVYFGGTIIQDLPEHSRLVHACDGRDRIHPTKAAGGTFLEQIYGRTPVTNSAHHQGISLLGQGLRVAQYSHDFVVEGIYHQKLPVIGVQWHPERMCLKFANVRMHDGAEVLRYFLSLL